MSWWDPRTWLGRGDQHEVPQGDGRSYDAARLGRRNEGWHATNASPDTVSRLSLDRLRARSRDLIRNNEHAASGIAKLVSNIIGDGIIPESRTGDPGLDSIVDGLFADWADECEASGQLGFYGCQTLACRAVLESGEGLVRQLPRRMSDGLVVPLQIQLLEADYLDATKDEVLSEGRVVRQGVEVDRQGRRVAYWLLPEHPGARALLPLSMSSLSQSVRVPAEFVAHVYEAVRPGQTRGLPWLAPSMQGLRDFADYQDAERVRKKLEACATAFVGSVDQDINVDQVGIAPAVTDIDGNVIEHFEPGLIGYLPSGKTVTFNAPATVGGYQEYSRTTLQGLAAGSRMTYELMTGDLSGVNFSSIRAGLIDFRRMVSAFQNQIFVRQFCKPVWSWFIDAAIAAGELPARDATGRQIRYSAVWTPPRFESVDRLKDAQADILEMRAMLASHSEIVRRRGRNLEDLIEEIDAGLDLLDSAGIVSDGDPRNTNKGGALQGESQAETIEDPVDQTEERGYTQLVG